MAALGVGVSNRSALIVQEALIFVEILPHPFACQRQREDLAKNDSSPALFSHGWCLGEWGGGTGEG